MTAAPDLSPITKTVEVPLSPDAAFTVFTRDMQRWWPLDQKSVSIGKGLAPSKVLRVEPHVGGQVVEVMVNGAEAAWGTILEWQPGVLFRMTWGPGEAATQPTDVTVSFEAVTAGCRVTLVHSGFDAYENGAERRANYDGGWEVLIGTLFARACAEG